MLGLLLILMMSLYNLCFNKWDEKTEKNYVNLKEKHSKK